MLSYLMIKVAQKNLRKQEEAVTFYDIITLISYNK